MKHAEFALKSIAENIVSDGAINEYLQASDEDQVKIAMAYFSSFSKKMDRINVVYNTTIGAKEMICLAVLREVQS